MNEGLNKSEKEKNIKLTKTEIKETYEINDGDGISLDIKEDEEGKEIKNDEENPPFYTAIFLKKVYKMENGKLRFELERHCEAGEQRDQDTFSVDAEEFRSSLGPKNLALVNNLLDKFNSKEK